MCYVEKYFKLNDGREIKINIDIDHTEYPEHADVKISGKGFDKEDLIEFKFRSGHIIELSIPDTDKWVLGNRTFVNNNLHCYVTFVPSNDDESQEGSRELVDKFKYTCELADIDESLVARLNGKTVNNSYWG